MANKPRHKVTLTKEKETLLITLQAKALDYISKNSILKDRKAYEIFRTLDYDFSKLRSDDDDRVGSVRAKQVDDWVEEFISANRNAVVLYLGCGLDTRIARVRPPLTVTWFDIDYPEVIKLRKEFFKEGSNYRMISSSITNPKWLVKIPKNRPVMIVAEGVFEYLSEKDIKNLLNRLTSNFSAGRIAFDALSKDVIKFAKKELKKQTGATHRWGINSISDVDKLNPKLKRLQALSLFESKYMSKLPPKVRKAYLTAAKSPPYKDAMRLLLYGF